VFKSWGYSGSHTLERLEKSSDVLRIGSSEWTLLWRSREITVDHSAADLGEKMGGTWRPTHLLSLAHPLIQDLVDGGFSHCPRNGLTGTVEFSMVDRGATIVLKVLEKLAQPIVQLLKTVLEFWRLCDDSTSQHQHLPHPILCFFEVCVPEAPPQLVQTSDQ
jgi:hypothetical protein